MEAELNQTVGGAPLGDVLVSAEGVEQVEAENLVKAWVAADDLGNFEVDSGEVSVVDVQLAGGKKPGGGGDDVVERVQEKEDLREESLHQRCRKWRCRL